ncbi:MAG: zinc metalloprotease HtpX [Armatimonadota bacterium]|nr:zinc metalloprotease HtpX [Armatimonadota bacterium]
MTNQGSLYNNFKTFILLAGLTSLFMGAGYLIGRTQGLIIAFGFALVMNFVSYWFSDKLALAMSGAREVSPDEAPELHRMVSSLAQRANLPMPRVCIIPEMTPNAFATGRDPNHSAVAVTEGIMQMLNRDELEGVIAHELAHIRHRDILISSIAAVLAGALTSLAHMLQFHLMFGGYSDDEEGGNPLGLIGALAMIILAPIAAMLIQMAISRSREFEADRGGAEICGHPLSLANALLKLERGVQMMPMNVNPATAHMYIVSPLSGQSLAGLFSTHPATEQRVARLQEMAREAAFAQPAPMTTWR